jgi:TPR repeat protein
MFLLFAFLIALQTAGTPATQPPNSAAEPVIQLTSADVTQLQAKAEAGDAAAQLALGRAYQNGDGVHHNDELAAKWYRKSADQGNAAAQNNLGVMYRAGLGVEKNEEEALKWYHMAARQGNANAMFNIGASYYDGDVERATELAAYEWFVLAEEAGSSTAREAVKRTAAELGVSFAQDALIEIAQMYEKGTDLPQNYSQAIKWYNRAAESGSASAKVQLASMYLNGNGVRKDYSRAMELCHSAGVLGYYCLGHLYVYGLGVPADVKEASKWYRKGADAGNSASMLALGQMYWKGTGVELDRAESYYYFFLAYSHREKSAQEYADQVAKEMTDGDTKRLNKKLKHNRLDPNTVQTFMHSDLPPERGKRLK